MIIEVTYRSTSPSWNVTKKFTSLEHAIKSLDALQLFCRAEEDDKSWSLVVNSEDITYTTRNINYQEIENDLGAVQALLERIEETQNIINAETASTITWNSENSRNEQSFQDQEVQTNNDEVYLTIQEPISESPLPQPFQQLPQGWLSPYQPPPPQTQGFPSQQPFSQQPQLGFQEPPVQQVIPPQPQISHPIQQIINSFPSQSTLFSSPPNFQHSFPAPVFPELVQPESLFESGNIKPEAEFFTPEPRKEGDEPIVSVNVEGRTTFNYFDSESESDDGIQLESPVYKPLVPPKVPIIYSDSESESEKEEIKKEDTPSDDLGSFEEVDYPSGTEE